MSGNLTELNNHLFAQLDRLSDENLSGEELAAELDRAKAVSGVAKDIIANSSLQLEALKLHAEHKGLSRDDVPKMIGQDQ